MSPHTADTDAEVSCC